MRKLHQLIQVREDTYVKMIMNTIKNTYVKMITNTIMRKKEAGN